MKRSTLPLGTFDIFWTADIYFTDGNTHMYRILSGTL